MSTLCVRLVLKGYLSWYTPGQISELDLAVQPGTTVRQVLEMARVPLAEVAIAVVDDRQCDPGAPVRDGQCITLIPPIGGG